MGPFEDGPETNLAYGRPTTQISTTWASSGAVDGVATTDGATTCSHTYHLGTLDAYPWWRVQLAGSYPIGTVRVSARPHLSSAFLNILVEDINGDTTLCGSANVTVPLGQAVDVVCRSLSQLTSPCQCATFSHPRGLAQCTRCAATSRKCGESSSAKHWNVPLGDCHTTRAITMSCTSYHTRSH